MAATAPDYANERWPGSGGLRVPQEVAPATLAVKKLVTLDFSKVVSPYTLPPTQALASELIVGTSTVATIVTFPAAFPGHIFVAYNSSSSGCTFKVNAQTGVSVGSGKRAVLVCESVDIARVTADT